MVRGRNVLLPSKEQSFRQRVAIRPVTSALAKLSAPQICGYLMNGQITGNFTPFLKVFKSYHTTGG